MNQLYFEKCKRFLDSISFYILTMIYIIMCSLALQCTCLWGGVGGVQALPGD